MTPLEILALPMDPNGNAASATSIRAYLVAMLDGAWQGEFNSEYGIEGESDWRHVLYQALVDAEAIPSPCHSGGGLAGYMRSDDAATEACQLGDDLIAAAIAAMHAAPNRGDLLAAAVAAEEEAKIFSRRADRLRQEADSYRLCAEARKRATR